MGERVCRSSGPITARSRKKGQDGMSLKEVRAARESMPPRASPSHRSHVRSLPPPAAVGWLGRSPGRRRGAGVLPFPVLLFAHPVDRWLGSQPTSNLCRLGGLGRLRTQGPKRCLASFSCLGLASLLFFSGPTCRFTWSVVLFVDHVLSRCRIPSSVAPAAVSHTLILPFSSSVDTRLGREGHAVYVKQRHLTHGSSHKHQQKERNPRVSPRLITASASAIAVSSHLRRTDCDHVAKRPFCLPLTLHVRQSTGRWGMYSVCRVGFLLLALCLRWLRCAPLDRRHREQTGRGGHGTYKSAKCSPQRSLGMQRSLVFVNDC
jgi:hypothetical protein